MLKIYGVAHSRAFRVIWLANELGLPYEHIPISFEGSAAECKKDWYLRLNPNGRVPTIDDGGVVLWESAAINLYLAEKYGGSLYPVQPEERGKVFHWTFFISNEVEPLLITILRNRVVFPPIQRNPDLADEAERALRDKLMLLEQHLVTQRYFGGMTWNMADFMVACVLYILRRVELDLSGYPKLVAWLNDSLERPAAKTARKLREK